MISYALNTRSIMYKMLYTRPNVSYTLNIMSRYQYNPNKNHWKIVKNILMYLKRTNNVFMVYEGDELVVHDSLDTSFQSVIDDNKFKLGYVFTPNDGVMSLKSFK